VLPVVYPLVAADRRRVAITTAPQAAE